MGLFQRRILTPLVHLRQRQLRQQQNWLITVWLMCLNLQQLKDFVFQFSKVVGLSQLIPEKKIPTKVEERHSC